MNATENGLMPDEATNPMVEAMGQLMDSMQILAEAVDGYRKSCEGRGYSPTVCEAMAFELHHELVHKMFNP